MTKQAYSTEEESFAVAGGAVAGLVAGALIGGTIGALTARERWERVPVP